MSQSIPSLHSSERITHIDIKPSPAARNLLLALYGLAVLSAFLTAGALWVQMLVWVFVLALIAWCEVCHRHYNVPIRLGISARKIQCVQNTDGVISLVLQYEFEYVTVCYIALRLRLADTGWQRLYLLADCTDAEHFRSLRVLGVRSLATA